MNISLSVHSYKISYDMIKLLIADNHPIIRKGLELLFSASSNIEIVGSVDNGEAIIDQVRRMPVDIIFYNETILTAKQILSIFNVAN